MKSTLVKKMSIFGNKIANFQLSILQFSNNYSMSEFSKRNVVASLFDNLSIGHYLKIGNWKLKIRELINIINGIKEDNREFVKLYLKVS